MARPTRRQIAEAYERQDERRRLTLARLSMWGEAGMAPCAAIGSGIGTLVALEGLGYAQRSPERDRFGDLRFVLTEAGRQKLEEGGL